MLAKQLGFTPKIEFHAPRVGDVRESLADITLARKLLGYEPQIRLEEGISRTIEYYRSTVAA
jgi:nucleoside-diphosphate-sugar epimerase